MSDRLEQLLANTVRDALHGDRVTDPVENWEAADRALSDLVIQAERADKQARLLTDMGDAIALSRGYIPSSEQFGALDINALLARLDVLGKDKP